MRTHPLTLQRASLRSKSKRKRASFTCPSPACFSTPNNRMVAATSQSPRRFLARALAALAVFFASLPLVAQGTHLWTQSRVDDFEKGTPQGVAIGRHGHLREGPALTHSLPRPPD